MEAYNIVSWNVNRRAEDVQGFDERKMFDHLRSEKVFLLQETALNSELEQGWRACFPEHSLYFSKGGYGLLIGVVKSMKSRYNRQATINQQGQLLFVDAELDGPGRPMTSLGCAYFKPSCSYLGSFACHLRLWKLQEKLCRKVLFAGDLNAKFGNLMCTASSGQSPDARVDKAGRYLAEFFANLGFRMVNGNVPGDTGATFPKRKNMSLGSRLDHVLVSGCVENVAELRFAYWMGSDHVALKASWNPSQTPIVPPAILGVQYTTYCG